MTSRKWSKKSSSVSQSETGPDWDVDLDDTGEEDVASSGWGFLAGIAATTGLVVVCCWRVSTIQEAGQGYFGGPDFLWCDWIFVPLGLLMMGIMTLLGLLSLAETVWGIVKKWKFAG